MDPYDRAIAILEQIMTKSYAHQEKTEVNKKTTEMEPTIEQMTELLKVVKEIETSPSYATQHTTKQCSKIQRTVNNRPKQQSKI
jgi:hypothetical protein